MDGGALMNQSIHHIGNALQWFMGPVASVHAYTATLGARHGSRRRRRGLYAARRPGVIEGSTLTWSQNLGGIGRRLWRAQLGQDRRNALNRITLWKVRPTRTGSGDPHPKRVDPPSVYGYSHREVIATSRTPSCTVNSPTPPAKRRKSLELVLAIYRSARTGQEVATAAGGTNEICCEYSLFRHIYLRRFASHESPIIRQP